MSKWEKLFDRIMAGDADENIRFSELCHFLQRLGYTQRIRGSHHFFQKSGRAPLNLQPSGANAKPYQVKQVRASFALYGDQP